MTIPTLSPRLRRAADLVRKGSMLADVGCDHAYLPIVLLHEGRIRGGVVSDINEGPLRRASHHIASCGMTDKLTPVLCDGLTALEKFHPDDVVILGMGGELIANILAAAPWIKNSSVRLILQPMTHPEALRAFLCREGFEIVEEALVEEEKIYQILCAEYRGTPTEYSQPELLFGKQNLARRDETCRRLLTHWVAVLKKRRDGKRSAGADTAEEDCLLQEIGELLP